LRGPVEYAQAAVVARAIKSRLLRADVLREAALAKDLGEALITLRESMYPGVGEAKTLTQALTSIWGGYFKTIRHMAKVTPGEALNIVLALEREEDLRDITTIAYRSAVGKPVEEKLPSAFYEGTLTYNILRDPELLASPQKILEFTEDTWAYKYVEPALRVTRELKGGATPLWAIPLLIARLYNDSMEGLSSEKRSGLERLLCPHIEYRLLSALVMARHLDIPSRFIDMVMGRKVTLCGAPLEELKGLYEREADPVSLAGELRGLLRDIRVEGKSVYEILFNSMRSSRYNLKSRAISSMSGYPFNPAFITASLVLLKLEVEMITFIVASKEYRVKPAEVVEKLGLETL
jgi:vacuolar-type H+-ATPase subunit C/Vma6